MRDKQYLIQLVDHLAEILNRERSIVLGDVTLEEREGKIWKKLDQAQKKMLRRQEKMVGKLKQDLRKEERDKSHAGEIIKKEEHEELGHLERGIHLRRKEEKMGKKIEDLQEDNVHQDTEILKDIEAQNSALERIRRIVARDSFGDETSLAEVEDAMADFAKIRKTKKEAIRMKREDEGQIYNLTRRERRFEKEEIKEDRTIAEETQHEEEQLEPSQQAA